MTRALNIITLVFTGTLAMGFIGNFLAHLAIYLYYGNDFCRRRG